jgi:hypothetical protein
MKQIYSARDEVDAELVKNALLNAGIEAIVQAGGLSNILGAVQVSEGSLPSIWVRDEDESAANEVLADYKHPPKPQGQPWTCPKCGEQIEPQFDTCWNCGTARPEPAA